MTQQIAMLIDDPATLDPNTDSSLSILLEAERRGYSCHIFQKHQLFLKNGEVYAEAQQGTVDLQHSPYFHVQQTSIVPLRTMQAIFIRIDPPVDQQYLYCTYLLDLVAQQGPLIVNHPTSIRNCNEKIIASHFPQLIPPTLISAHLGQLQAFLSEHQHLVLKPLNGLGGRGIVLVQDSDLDKLALLQLLTENQQKAVVAQRFLPAVHEGDKRILLIDGEPVQHVLLRTPQKADFRANLAAGGNAAAIDLSARDLEICQTLKPFLQQNGLFLVGIDVIGGYLTEINVTSPTGAVVLERLTSTPIFKPMFDTLEKRLQSNAS